MAKVAHSLVRHVEHALEATILAAALLLLLPAPAGSQTTAPSPPMPASVPARVVEEAADPWLATVAALKQSEGRWIEIRLKTQRLIAWEGDRAVRAVIVSTGKRSTPTPRGSFAIQSKHRTASMRGADYDISGVPYVMYYSGNYGIHGTTWHNRFGTPVSHGCTNVAVDHAKWLFHWAAVGTPVVVRD